MADTDLAVRTSPRKELIVIEKPISQRQKEPPLWDVIMLDDDYTPMPFVVGLLVEHFNKSIAEAECVMMRVHNEGRAVAGRYPKDIAQTKCENSKNCAKKAGHPFMIVIEKVTP